MSKLFSQGVRKLGYSGVLLAVVGQGVMCRDTTVAQAESNQSGTLIQFSHLMGFQHMVMLDPFSKSPFVTAEERNLPARLFAQVGTPTGFKPSLSGSKPQFGVASIKTCKDKPVSAGRSEGNPRWSPGRLSIACVTVADLIRWAYLLYPDGKPWRETVVSGITIEKHPPVSNRLLRQSIKGSPSWIESDRYTIDATSENPSSEALMAGPMMQTLLEERFKLKIHKETRELPVYELTAARGGPRLSVTREGTCVLADADHPLPIPPPPRVCGQIIGSNSGLDGHGVSMNSLCEVLSELLNQDVIDKTGIAGIFDIHFDIDMESMRAEVAREALKARPDQGERDEPGLTDNIWRSVFLSPFQSQMQKVGLKLQQAKAPGEFLVIDYIERPSGN